MGGFLFRASLIRLEEPWTGPEVNARSTPQPLLDLEEISYLSKPSISYKMEIKKKFL